MLPIPPGITRPRVGGVKGPRRLGHSRKGFAKTPSALRTHGVGEMLVFGIVVVLSRDQWPWWAL